MGFGVHASGAEAAEYYAELNNEVDIYEPLPRESFASMPQRLESKGIRIFFEEINPKDISKYDLVVKTPATPMNMPLYRKARALTNDFAALLRHPAVEKMKKIVIVGNKGKTLLASAIVHSLNMLGAKAQMCGVIGMSGYHLLREIEEKGGEAYTHLVFEMATWQISDTFYSLEGQWPKLDVVVLTSRADAHKVDKKENYSIFGSWVEKAIIGKESRNIFLQETMMNKKKVFSSPSTFNPERGVVPNETAFDVLKALGYHKKDIEKALSTYRGIPHRMEQVGFKNGILYINDSAATLPESVAYSFKTMGQASIHLILGGSEKSTMEMGSLRSPLKYAASITLLAGSFTEKLIPVLEKKGIKYEGPFERMEDAVASAREKANFLLSRNTNTQIILLSPGASGFEYFQNEFRRGDKFKAIVKKIINESSNK